MTTDPLAYARAEMDAAEFEPESVQWRRPNPS